MTYCFVTMYHEKQSYVIPKLYKYKIIILAVSVLQLSVPSLNLLPGQIHMMKEIIEKEKIRQRLLSIPPPPSCSDTYVTVQSEMPS